jgi:hypothetical protein
MLTRELCELYAAYNHMFVSCLRLPSVTVAAHKYQAWSMLAAHKDLIRPAPRQLYSRSGTGMPDTKPDFSGTILV